MVHLRKHIIKYTIKKYITLEKQTNDWALVYTTQNNIIKHSHSKHIGYHSSSHYWFT